MGQYSLTTSDDEERLSIEKELSLKSPRTRLIRIIILGLIFSILGAVLGGICLFTSPSTYCSLLGTAGFISLLIAYFLDCYQSKNSGVVVYNRIVDIIAVPVTFIIGIVYPIIILDSDWPLWQLFYLSTMVASVVTMVLLIAGLFIVKSPFGSTQEYKSTKKIRIVLIGLIIVLISVMALTFIFLHWC